MIPTNFVDVLRHQAHEKPDATAFMFLEAGEQPRDCLTYQQLDSQAQVIASQLQALGLVGQRAILVYPPGLEFISAFMGCLYAGVVAIPAYPPGRERWLNRLQAIATDAQGSVILTTQPMLTHLQQRFPQILGWQHLTWLTSDTCAAHPPGPWQPPNVDPEALALLQYTSGSTALPKAVKIGHGNLMHNAQAIATAFSQHDSAMVVGWLPIYHDMGLIGNVLQPLYLGRPCILMPPAAVLQQPIRWLQAIAKYRATTSGGPNFIYDLCVRKIAPPQRTQLDLSSWQIAFNGAEPVRASTLKQFAKTFAECGFRPEAFYPCYGMAEATLFIGGGQRNLQPRMESFNREAITQHRAQLDTSENGIELVACGQTWLEQKLAIIHPKTRQRCLSNEIGEIWVTGPSIAQGYWQNPQASEQTFNAYTADGHGPYLRTGDTGCICQGQLYVTGRLKDLIIIRGRNYYPQDIELAVRQSHPALRPECGAAFSVEVAGIERVAIAQEVERRYVRNVPVDEIIAAIRTAVLETCELQVYSIALLRPATIPKTSSGKIRRRACWLGYHENTLEVIAQWQSTPQQHDLQQLQTDVEHLWQWLIAATERPSNSSESQDKSHAMAEKEGRPASAEPLALTVSDIQAWLVSRLATVLEVPPEAIDVTKPFVQYGLDSSVAISLTGELMEWLGRPVEPTLFWQDFTIESLTHYLIEEYVQLPAAA